MDKILDFLGERPDFGEPWLFDAAKPVDSPGNALALGTLALLAYSDPDAIQKFLADLHFPDDTQFLSGDNSFGFVARQSASGPVFISYKGTEPTMLAEVVADINYAQQQLNGLQGKVHGGFGRAFASVKDATEKALDGFPGARCYFTGHSLGGAIAVLAAARFRDRATAVCTFGQPRVGDTEFSSAYDQELGEKTFRFVNNYDLIPHVPPVKLPAPLPVVSHIAASFSQLLADIENDAKTFFDGEPFAHVGQLRLFIDGTFPQDAIAGQTISEVSDDFDKHDLIGLRGISLDHPLRRFIDDATILANEVRGLPDHDPKRGYLRRLQQRVNNQ